MLTAEQQIKHGPELRRCLVQMDAPAMRRLWEHCCPGMTRLSPSETLIAMHIARCDMRYVHKRLKEYSRDWLAGEGIQKIDGRWTFGLPKPTAVAEAVGISSRSSVPGLAQKVMVGMRDALLNSLAKGITEPPMQKEAMQKARQKIRFRGRHI